MERKDYSLYSQEQLAIEGESLNNRLKSAQEVLEGIATPGFVENRRLQKPNSNPRWLEKFNLKGLGGETYFNKLGRDIIPIQLRLKQQSIPVFQGGLREVHEETHIRTSTGVLNLIMEDPSFNLEKAITMLTTHQPITPQKALEDLTHTVNILNARGSLKRLDPLGVEILGKISIFSNFKQDLTDWFGNPAPAETTQAVEQRKETSIVVGKELMVLTNRIIDLIPAATVTSWSNNQTLTPEQYQQQAINFAESALRVQEEGGPSFNPMELVNTPEGKRLEVAQKAIRNILSQMILTHSQKQLVELHQRWGNKLRELIDWLGGGGVRLVGGAPKNYKRPISEKVRELVVEAIDNLPEVERAMVLEISSLALLKDLGYLGLEECNEDIFATYLRDAAFIPDSQQDRRDTDFEFLLDKAIERSDAGTLDLTLLIDILCEPSYKEFIIEKIRESAEFRRFEHLLVIFFVSHPDTKPFAREIEGFLSEDPYNRRLRTDEEEFGVKLPSHRRQ